MKDHNNNGKVDVTDTPKNIPEDPAQAIKDDYKQTKADMHNLKDNVKEKLTDEDDTDAKEKKDAIYDDLHM
jgi:hypothetical protein